MLQPYVVARGDESVRLRTYVTKRKVTGKTLVLTNFWLKSQADGTRALSIKAHYEGLYNSEHRMTTA